MYESYTHTEANTNQEKDSALVTVPGAPQPADTPRNPQDSVGWSVLQIRRLHQGSKYIMDF